jgi:L-aspartate oxidase
MLATGGIGNIYQSTTNPTIATGDGIAMAYRAKGICDNMEFIQFHPYELRSTRPESLHFLISEAVRGFGGVLKRADGSTFMENYDRQAVAGTRVIL